VIGVLGSQKVPWTPALSGQDPVPEVGGRSAPSRVVGVVGDFGSPVDGGLVSWWLLWTLVGGSVRGTYFRGPERPIAGLRMVI
jgi:hypothetical protein